MVLRRGLARRRDWLEARTSRGRVREGVVAVVVEARAAGVAGVAGVAGTARVAGVARAAGVANAGAAISRLAAMTAAEASSFMVSGPLGSPSVATSRP